MTLDNNELCLISKEPIEHKITLECNHSFEYYYLYEEIKQQKQRHRIYFKCPYCRNKYNGTIPYYEIEGVDKINYINYTNKTLLPLLKCCKDNCNLYANKYINGCLCIKHKKASEIVTCTAICKNGKQCSKKQIINGVCNVHNKIKNKCSAICKNGNVCKFNSIEGFTTCKIHTKKDNK